MGPLHVAPISGATVSGGEAEPATTDIYGVAVLSGLGEGSTSIEVDPPGGCCPGKDEGGEGGGVVLAGLVVLVIIRRRV